MVENRGSSADSPNYPPVHANAVLAGLLFFPGSCFDRQIFQCIVSIITTRVPSKNIVLIIGVKNMAAYDIEKDIGPRVQIIQEIHELILAGEMEVAKGMLRTLIKVTFAYPAIFDEVRQECQINNAHVVAGCGSGYQSVYSRCQSCRTSVRKSSGPG